MVRSRIVFHSVEPSRSLEIGESAFSLGEDGDGPGTRAEALPTRPLRGPHEIRSRQLNVFYARDDIVAQLLWQRILGV